MASRTLEVELPIEVMEEFQRIYDDTDEILGGMVKAGAEDVEGKVVANVPASFRGSNIMKCLKITRVYKTLSDDGINCKVGFYGYFTTRPTKTGKTYRHPAPLVANVFEYGSSKVSKKPFFRKSFNKSAITRVMMAEQKKLSGGLLDEQ